MVRGEAVVALIILYKIHYNSILFDIIYSVKKIKIYFLNLEIILIVVFKKIILYEETN